MKSTPKLQDTLEVFLDQLENLKYSFGTIEKASSEPDMKISRLKQIKISPDLREFSSVATKFQNSQTQHIEQMSKMQTTHLEALKTQLKKSSERMNFFYLLIFVMFLLGGTSTFMASKYYFESQKLIQANYNLDLNSKSMSDFIRGTKQVKRYNDWFDTESSVK